MTTLPLAAIKRIAAVRGDKYRVGEDAVTLIDAAATEWIRGLATEAYIFTVHAGRTTLKASDIIPILEKRGMKIPVVSAQKPKPSAQKTAAKKNTKKE
jgi:histone H3/H4